MGKAKFDPDHDAATRAEFNRLNRRNEYLEARCQELQAALAARSSGAIDIFRQKFGMTITEAAILAELQCGGVKSRERLATVVAAARCVDMISEASIDVYMVKVRKKLAEHAPSVKIINIHGTGYCIADAALPLKACLAPKHVEGRLIDVDAEMER